MFSLQFFLLAIPALICAHRATVHQILQTWQPTRSEELSDNCRSLFGALLAECQKQSVHPDFVAPPSPWQDCESAVSDLWFNTSKFSKDQSLWLFRIFVNHTQLHNETALSPIFWAGFSFRLGTRDVMDEIMESLPVCAGDDFLCADIEHSGSSLGKLMRKGSWFRPCHATKEDVHVWVHLSRAFSMRRQQVQSQLGKFQQYLLDAPADLTMDNKGLQLALKRVRRQIEQNSVVTILVNKEEAELSKAFLFQYEIPLISKASSVPKLRFLTFKTSCAAIRDQVPKHLHQGMNCTSLSRYSPQDSVPDPSTNALIRFKWKLLCLEDGFSPDKNHSDQIRCCNQGGEQCWFDAIEKNQFTTVKYLSVAFPELVDAISWRNFSALGAFGFECDRALGAFGDRALGMLGTHLAARNGSLETLQYLQKVAPHQDSLRVLRDGTDRTDRALGVFRFTAFHFAAYYGHLPMVEFLASSLPEMVRERTRTDRALGMKGVFRLRLERMKGVFRLRLERLRFECASGLERALGGNKTALHLASYRGNLAVVKYLSKHFPDLVQMRGDKGKTALHEAAKTGHLAVVEYLSKHFPDLVDMRCCGKFWGGYTALELTEDDGVRHFLAHFKRPSS
eukprot:TRINITY_DN2923_c0_g1_i5.p1 TRINITY_DN2923_c0_g1~~TRINITY_DN2923_c0_g1_i5.p1  ORF type:complete len:621 (+),score=82.78 TRINITY_DN2923_c0_g1_i5:84-1946(+)